MRVGAWMVCAVVVLAALLLVLTPHPAEAGTWTNTGNIDNMFPNSDSGVRISGNETTDAYGVTTIPPWFNWVPCIIFGAFSTWNTEQHLTTYNGSSWSPSQSAIESYLTTPCGIGFNWGSNSVRDGDASAGTTTNWILRASGGTAHNLVASYGPPWTSEILPTTLAGYDESHMDAQGMDALVSAVGSGTVLEVYQRSALTSTWTQLPNISVGAPTAIDDDVAFVNNEPWVISTHTIGSKGQLYVHRFNGTSWVQVGTGPLNQDPVNGNVTSVAISNDSNNHPFISFVEGTSVYVEQWNGTSWVLIGGSAVGTGSTADVAVNKRIDRAYVTWSGASAKGHKLAWWDGSGWRGPVTSDASTTWSGSSLAIAKGIPFVGALSGSTPYAYKFVTSAANVPTATGGPAALSATTTPTLNLSGTWSGDAMGMYWANQWQVRTSAGSYATPAWDSGVAPTGTSTTTAALPDGNYCYHVRWADQELSWGAYSTEYCGWTIDATPPPVPATRNDGTGADITWLNSATTISANWSAVTDNLSGLKNYDYCVSTSSTGSDCSGAATIPWTTQTGTSFTRSIALTQGTTYYTCIRARDNSAPANVSAAGCTNGQTVDSLNPTAPTLQTPASSAYLIGTPASLTARYNDAVPGSPGGVFFQLCADAACSSVLQSGWSSSTVLVQNVDTGTFNITALATGTYYWRAYGRDSALNVGPYTAIQSFTVNYIPSAPTALTPAAGAWTNSTAPVFQAQYVDPGDTGSIRFELCATNATPPWSTNCGASYQVVDSMTGLTSGSLGSASFNGSFPDGNYYWRAAGFDSYGELGPYATAQALGVDTTTPTTPVVQSVKASGVGKATLAYSAATDSGSGTVKYTVAYSTNAGSTWTTACSAITATSCQATGLGNLTPVLMRVQACDLANNCTSWQTGAGATGQPYYPRTTQASTLLTTAAQVQAATLTGPADTTTTRIKYATSWSNSSPGYYTVQPAASNATNLGATAPTAPINTNPGRGWVIDAVAGKSIAAGDLTFEFTTDTGNGGADNGTVQCRAYVVTTSGGTTITASTPIGTPATAVGTGSTTGTDVINGASGSTWSCAPGGLPAQIALSSNQAIYVELVVQVTSSVWNWNDEYINFHMNGTQSAITIPGSGTFPNAPAPVAPANAAITTQTPTLQATYTHPTPVNGSIMYDVATDAAFTNVVQTGVAAGLANNATGNFTTSTLTAGTTYYWRTHAVDNVGLVSGFSATQSFTVSTAPVKPVNATPPGSAIVRTATPTLGASAFSDVDPGDSQSRAQWQVRTSTGAYSNAVDDTTSASDLTSHVLSTALVNTKTYCWRVRYRDSYNVWSAWSTESCFQYDSSGGAISVSLDSPIVNLGTLAANTDTTGVSVLTVSSANMTGYTVNATDASDTYGLTGSSNVPDWTGTNAAPTTWPAGTGPYFGITVLGVSGTTTTKDPKWGTGTLATDFVNNKYAGVKNSSNVVLHSRGSFSLTSDVVTFAYRFNAGAANAGSYAATLTVTVVPNA